MSIHFPIAAGPTPRFCPNCNRSMKVPGHYVEGYSRDAWERTYIVCPFDYGGECRHENWRAEPGDVEMSCTLCGATWTRLRAERVWELERALGYDALPFLGHDPTDKLPIDEAFTEGGYWKNPNLPSRDEHVRQMEAALGIG